MKATLENSRGVLEVPLSGIQKALASLELDGLVAGRTVGRMRLYRLEPRSFALDALRAFRGVVFRGAGTEAFAAGADISEFQTARTAERA